MTKEALNAVRLGDTKYKVWIKNKTTTHIQTTANTLNTCLADKQVILECIFEDKEKKKKRGGGGGGRGLSLSSGFL